MKQSSTIIFFGSGPVAAKSLKLLKNSFEIEAVITKPTTVSEMTNIIPGECVYSVNDKEQLDDLISSKQFKSRLAVLIDFGIIVSKNVIDSFQLGIINSHFSILPEWRGADPITFAILSGQRMTGVSLMMLVEKMDEGPLVGYGEQPLDGTETTPELTEKLIKLSYALLQHDIPRIFSGEAKGTPQSITGRDVSYSRKLTKDDGILEFTKPAEQLEREVRAFIEWPRSRTILAGKDVIVTKAHVAAANDASEAGSVYVTKDKHIAVHCSNGVLIIEALKPAGKPEMSAEAFLAGYGNKL
jgi:methionyl-tRNA formyltransferase